MDLDAKQQTAVSMMVDTLTSEEPGAVTIAGPAGTGKTSIIQHALRSLPMYNVAVCAFTGKAAHVLRQKGVGAAQTLHSLIYHYDPELDEFHRRHRLVMPHSDSYDSYEPTFVDAVVVDEASTISQALYDDLMSFGLPVVFVGDNHQLEPVGDNPDLMARPDFELDTIYRQEEGSGILDVAHAYRHRQRPEWNDDAALVPRKDAMACMLDYDVLLCGRNATRASLNATVRQMQGRGKHVEDGDRVVVLRNNYQHGVFNGMLMDVERIHSRTKYELRVTLVDPDTGHRVRSVRAVFGDSDTKADRDTLVLDYGYALSVHKSQGSSWKTVMVFDERGPWDQTRWRYTAATRASNRLGWVS